jgi:hypothetical protein
MENENDTNGRKERIANDGLFGFEEWWAVNKVKIEPPIMQEAFRELSLKSWNAALKAADYVIWRKRDGWDERNGYSPTKTAAAEEIGYAVRRLSLPNVKEHATLSARARVDHGVEVKTIGEHVNRAADRGCVSRLVGLLHKS